MSKHDEATSPALIALRGMVRRMVVAKAGALLWDLLGVQVGTTAATRERPKAEAFYGIGIAALPAANGRPEAIVLNVGAAKAPVIVAARDAKTQQEVVPTLAAGDICVYSSGAIVHVRADGTVEIRTPNGVAKRLATVDDVNALAVFVNNLAVGGTGSAVIPPNTVPRPVGTQVLKGE